ncbi:MAG: hypothetical protein RXR06_11915, partial [Thermoproteus sp.]
GWRHISGGASSMDDSASINITSGFEARIYSEPPDGSGDGVVGPAVSPSVAGPPPTCRSWVETRPGRPRLRPGGLDASPSALFIAWMGLGS